VNTSPILNRDHRLPRPPEATADSRSADVLDFRLTDLPIILFPQGGRLPLADAAVDATLLYLVLHHADDPKHLLREAPRVTRQRLVIMEGYVEDPATRVCNSFFDWFLNRVVQGADINLLHDYCTIAERQLRFAENRLSLVHSDPVGIDESRAPEAHVLHVLDKARGSVASPCGGKALRWRRPPACSSVSPAWNSGITRSSRSDGR